MPDYETFEHDVLVIGAGGAGLRAAIEASATGVRVGLVCKSLLGKAHTVMAEGGIAAALANVDDRDNWKVHFADTMRGGQYVNSWRMAQLHAQEAADRVRELEAWGAVFDRTKDGRILQRNFGGHKYPRLAHVGDRTGLEMIRTLQDHGIHQGMSVYMECTIIQLLKDGDRISGAFGYHREKGRFVLFKAKAVVLATGGIGKAYKITSNSWEYTGDGHTLAYNAGERWKKKLPSMYHQFKELANVDITKTPMEVGPTTHYVMGGIRVDGDSQMSKIPGLFACGECAAGINGANRLGGNSLSDLLVFGKRAGEYAARYAKEQSAGQISSEQAQEAERWALAFMDEPKGEENPYKVQQEL